jgi:hypothetical protein
VVVLSVVRPRPFRIGGDLTAPLYPGRRAPLDLVLTNPHSFDLRVISLTVSVREKTSRPACSGGANFAVTQYSGAYPLLLPPGTSRLSTLVSDATRWPQLSMHDLATNQDACKQTALTLDYRGQATE